MLLRALLRAIVHRLNAAYKPDGTAYSTEQPGDYRKQQLGDRTIARRSEAIARLHGAVRQLGRGYAYSILVVGVMLLVSALNTSISPPGISRHGHDKHSFTITKSFLGIIYKIPLTLKLLNLRLYINPYNSARCLLYRIYGIYMEDTGNIFKNKNTVN